MILLDTNTIFERMRAEQAPIDRATNARMATSNLKDFDGCHLRVMNPWGAA